MPLVSIIIPVFNPGPYLSLAVASVLNQTYKDWELIVIDDGSSEDLSYVKSQYPQTKLIRQENSGQSVARNLGIRNSQGTYIALLDQDDLWEPSKLDEQVARMEANVLLGLCHTDFDIVDMNGRRIAEGFRGYNKNYLELLKGCGICASTCLIRRDSLGCVGYFDPFLAPVADYDLWLKIARYYEIARVPERLASWRSHERNDSGNYWKMYTYHILVLQKHLKFAQLQGDDAAVGAARDGIKRAGALFGAQALDEARASLRTKDLRSFAKHCSYTFLLNPKFLLRSVASKICWKNKTERII